MTMRENEGPLLVCGDEENGDCSKGNGGGYYIALAPIEPYAKAGEKEAARCVKCRRTMLVLALMCVGIVVSVSAVMVFFLWPSPNGDGPSNAFYQASRTGFHFQPIKNWMNDPNGPMYYKGYYHFFYQYNPEGTVWANISWGHAVSTDLIHWMYLDLALVPDEWYDIEGVWSGSATIMPDGTPAILYTGSRNGKQQSQSLAVPVDPTDPLLRKWVKSVANPVLINPDGIDSHDFRDPTTAWMESDGLWRLVIGAKQGTTGIALLYSSADFKNWKLEDQNLHSVPTTGMWECVDFFPVGVKGVKLEDGTASRETLKYVMKASLDNTRHDHYVVGSYNTETHSFTADDSTLDIGIGWRYDYGKFYASKTFYDPLKERRILWGWVNESDSEADDATKGWASVQAIPRTVWLDDATGTNLLQWPVEEVECLRGAKTSEKNLILEAGSVSRVLGADGPQLDIEVSFDYPNVTFSDSITSNDDFDCSPDGAARRSVFGPFGLLVHAEENLQEQTAIFFYVTPTESGHFRTKVCSDQSRSSLAPELDKTVYGADVTILPTENTLSLRILVDHSIVETFVQGGRLSITSRVYPTLAIESKAHIFLFNNGTAPVRLQSLDVWQLTNDLAQRTNFCGKLFLLSSDFLKVPSTMTLLPEWTVLRTGGTG